MRWLLEPLVPLACAWASYHERFILQRGRALTPAQLRIANQLSVRYPERVRLLATDLVPPVSALLRVAGQKLGVISSGTIGMTLRYGIYIHSRHTNDQRLLVHELVHVAQYERMGGIYKFLREYLWECVRPGYPFGPLEQEAKSAEKRHCGSC